MNRSRRREEKGRAHGRSIAAFDRIVFLLLALAGLADRVAAAPMPVRAAVLWALRRADTVAADFVATTASNMPGRYWSPAFACLQYEPGPADPTALARSLRLLAQVVRDMAAQLRRRAPDESDEWIDTCQVRLLRSFRVALRGLLPSGRLVAAGLDSS